MSGDYVSVKEAAERVGVSERTIRRWIGAGRLEPEPGRSGRMVSLSQVRAAAAEHGLLGAAPSTGTGHIPAPEGAVVESLLRLIEDQRRELEALRRENFELAGHAGFLEGLRQEREERRLLPAPPRQSWLHRLRSRTS